MTTPTFDASTGNKVSSGTTNTFSHTVASQNSRVILVSVDCGATVSSITYAGTNLTQLASVSEGGGETLQLWYLLAPATGANNVVITCSGTTFIVGASASYYNVAQNSTFGTTATNTGTAATSSTNTVATTSSSQVVYDVVNNTLPAANSATASQTKRFQPTGSGVAEGDIAATGSNMTLTWSWTGAGTWAQISVALNPPITPLTIYGSDVADATLTTACDCANPTGGTETSKTNTATGTNVYGEVTSQTNTTATVTSIPTTPTGNGWVYKPGSGVFATGNWGFVTTLSFGTGATVNSLTVRFFKYSGGSYTSIGTIVFSGTINVAKTTYTFTSTSMSSISFGASDLLYTDLWIHDPAGANDGQKVYESTSATLGVVNDVQITTSTFTPGTQVFKDVTVRGKVSATVFKDVSVRGKLSATARKDISARGNISIGPNYKDITTRGKVSATVGKDITVRGKVSRTIFKDISVRGKVSATVFKDITIRGIVSSRLASGGFTLYANGTGTAQFDTYRVTQYPDPSLSLSTVGRAGSTLVAWNDILPSGATLGVDTSLDGVNWTDVSLGNGGGIPGIFAQPQPTVDLFTSNTSVSYTSTYGTGGGVATWTYDTAHSRISATGGTSAIYSYGGLPQSSASFDLLCDMDQSDAGGLVWSMVDQNNFYILVIGDNQASVGTPNRATLYKVSSGTQTQLAQASIVFPRGTYHRFRATTLSGVITATMDGATLFTYTDNSPLAAGNPGLYNNGGTTGSRYYQLWIQPQGDYVGGTPFGDTVTAKFVYVRHRLATSNTQVTPQVLDTTLMVSDPNVGAGTLIPSANYQYTFVDKNLDDLSKQSNYSWTIDQNLNLLFRSRAATPAPWILQSVPGGMSGTGDIEADNNLSVEVVGDTYRNRQVLTGVTNTGPFSNTFAGDTKRTSFTLSYPVTAGTVPTITLNSNAQTVGLKGTTGSQWYYAPADATIAQDTSGTLLVSTDSLVVSYTGTFTTTVVVNNTAAQATQKAVEVTGTGIVESVIDVSNVGMMYAAAVTYATQLLARFCITGRTIIFKTYRNGLAVGQLLPVFVPEENVFNSQMLITAIDITVQTQPNNTQLYGYLVTATELPNKASWQKLLASALLLDTTGGP